jgi:hypothetical protein
MSLAPGVEFAQAAEKMMDKREDEGEVGKPSEC